MLAWCTFDGEKTAKFKDSKEIPRMELHVLGSLMIFWNPQNPREQCQTLMSYYSMSSQCSSTSWVSQVPGLGSKVSCQRTFPSKNPTGSSEAKIWGFHKFHKCHTLPEPTQTTLLKTIWEKKKILVACIFSFSKLFFYSFNCLVSKNASFLLFQTNPTFYITLNPFPNKPLFPCVWSTNLLKSLWEKEKLFFSYSVFCP